MNQAELACNYMQQQRSALTWSRPIVRIQSVGDAKPIETVFVYSLSPELYKKRWPM